MFKVAETAGMCRSKFGVYSEEAFNIHACVWCYHFIFPGHAYVPYPSGLHLVMKTNHTQTVQPDTRDKSSMSSICSTLNEDECDRWLRCCQDASNCCARHSSFFDANIDVNHTCPPTWDGYGCWDAGTPGQTSEIACPSFLEHAVPTSKEILFYNNKKNYASESVFVIFGCLSNEISDSFHVISFVIISLYKQNNNANLI